MNYYKSVLTNVGWECKFRSRCPRKNSGWRVCWRRITLVIRSYWSVVGASRRRITSRCSPRVFQGSRIRGREVSRWGLERISFRVVESNMVGRWCSLSDLCIRVL